MVGYYRKPTKQPQQITDCDWSYPGLDSLWLPALASYVHRNQPQQIVSVSKTSWVGPSGCAVEVPFFTTPNGELLPTLVDGTVEASYHLILEVRRVDQTFTARPLLGSRFQSSTFVGVSVSGNGTSLLVEGWCSVGFGGTVGSFSITQPGVYVLGFSFGQTARFKGYLNGALSFDVAAGTFRRGQATCVHYWDPGADTLATQGTALLVHAAGLSRELPDSEFKYLAEDPWRMLKKKTLYIKASPLVPITPISTIKHDRKRISQPKSSVGIDWSNPLAEGLVAGASYSTPTREFVSGAAPTLSRGIAASPAGFALSGATGLASYESSDLINTACGTTQPRTVLIYLATTTTGNTVILEKGSNESFVCQTDGGKFSWRASSTSVVKVDSTTNINTGIPVVVAGRFANRRGTVFVDGRNEGLSTDYDATVANSSPLVVGARTGDIAPMPGQVYCWFIWSRALSDEEIAQISANPWQLFKPATLHLKAAPLVPVTPVSSVKHKRKRVTQPPGSAEANPQWGASRLWTPTTGEVVAGLPPSIQGSTPGVTIGGLAAIFSGGTQQDRYTSPQADGSATLVAQFVVNGTGNQTISGLFSSSIDSGLYIAIEGGVIRTWAVEAGTFTDVRDPDSVVVGRLYTVVTSSVAGGGRRMFINGRFVAESTTARTMAQVDRWTFGLYDMRGVTGAPLNGALMMSAVLPMALPDSLAIELSANPWQLFKSPTLHIKASQPLSLIPTIFAMVPTNITTSTVRPRYQLTF